MKTYSKTLVYKNGNKVIVGEGGDHTQVRQLLNTGIVPRVSNFGPLTQERQIHANQIFNHKGFQFHVVHLTEVHGFALGKGLTTEKNVNNVYYQRITP